LGLGRCCARFQRQRAHGRGKHRQRVHHLRQHRGPRSRARPKSTAAWARRSSRCRPICRKSKTAIIRSRSAPTPVIPSISIFRERRPFFKPNGSGCDPLAALQSKFRRTVCLRHDPDRPGVARAVSACAEHLFGRLSGPPGALARDRPALRRGYLKLGIALSAGDDRNRRGLRDAVGRVAQRIRPRLLSEREAAFRSGRQRRGHRFRRHDLLAEQQRGGCAGSVVSTTSRSAQGALRKPAICCAPTGPRRRRAVGLDASTGVVLNGGNRSSTRADRCAPPTIDGIRAIRRSRPRPAPSIPGCLRNGNHVPYGNYAGVPERSFATSCEARKRLSNWPASVHHPLKMS
jgi:hypothetical protein